MLIICTLKSFSKSIRTKLQKRDRPGRFAKRFPTAKQVEKNPLVTFNYPSSKHGGIPISRRVWLISSTPTHFTGLEQTAGGKGGGTKYHFKKFLYPKAVDFRVMLNPK